MPADKTIDFVVMFLVIGLLVLGLGSMLIGWLANKWDQFVNRSQPVMSPAPTQTERTGRTDGRTDYVSEADLWFDRLEVDRTKTAVIEVLVYNGWTVDQVRKIIKGENAALGAEIEAARQRLGITDEPRMLRVKDDAGERLIPMEP